MVQCPSIICKADINFVDVSFMKNHYRYSTHTEHARVDLLQYLPLEHWLHEPLTGPIRRGIHTLISSVHFQHIYIMDAVQAHRLRGFGGSGRTAPLLGLGVDCMVVGTCGIAHALSWEGMLKPFPYVCVEPCVAVHMLLNMHVGTFTHDFNKYGLS